MSCHDLLIRTTKLRKLNFKMSSAGIKPLPPFVAANDKPIIYFCFFYRKYFPNDISCKLSFKKAMFIIMNCQIRFYGKKIQKNISKCSLLNLLRILLSVNLVKVKWLFCSCQLRLLCILSFSR